MSQASRPPKNLGRRERKVLSGHAGEDAHHGFISRARSSAKFVEERQPSFNWWQFSTTFLYHISWPLCLPLVAAIEGVNAMGAFQFIPVELKVVPGLIGAASSVSGIILYYILFAAASEAERLSLMPEMFVRLHIGYYVARQTVIAIKYAYIPTKHYTQMMRASYHTSWAFNAKVMLVTAWLTPTEDIIRRELALASARLQLDASRYEVTVDKRLREYLHKCLSVGLKTRAESGGAFFGGKKGSGSSIVPTAPVRQGSFLSNPHLRAWEKRCLCGKVSIEDLATVMVVASTKDSAVSISTLQQLNNLFTFFLLFTPYILLAVEGRITSLDTSVPHMVANVLINLGAFLNVGSLLLFMLTAERDYLMRARIQSVLTQLSRPIAGALVEHDVNILMPNAVSSFNSRVSSKSTQEDVSRDLDSIVDLDLKGDDDSPTPADTSTEVQVTMAGQSPPLDDTSQGTGVGAERKNAPVTGSAGLSIGLPPSAAEGKESAVQEGVDATGADGLLEDLGGADGKNASSFPPIIDVTRPSNAFAWIKLKQLLGETGSRFQLRMQMYLGVISALILALVILALVRVVGEGKQYGDDATTELLIFASILHAVFIFAVLWGSVILGAFANAETDQQAEALIAARVELQEVGRELLLAIEHKAAVAAYAPTPGPGAGMGYLAESDGGTPFTAGRPGSAGSTSSAVGRDYSVGGGGGKTLHNVSGAVSSMALSHVSALFTGIQAASEALRATIEALQINRDAHPIRVVGFPATYGAARLMITLVFTAAATLGGRGLATATQ